MAETSLELVIAREKELEELYKRMDFDAKLLKRSPYKMPRLDNEGETYDSVVNVTMNYAATTCDDLSRLLSNATMQLVVEGSKNNRALNLKEQSRIEDFINLHLDMIDDNLIAVGMPTLKQWNARHITGRGWIAGRYYAWQDGKDYIPDLGPWDVRYMAWVMGRRELDWASCRTFLTAREINKEWPDAGARGDQLLEVIYFYDDEKWDVWLGSDAQTAKLLTTEKHGLGYVPVIIVPCPEGFSLRDKDYIKYEGESALALDRNLYDEWNRVASLEMTSAQDTIMPGYTHETSSMAGEGQPYPGETATNQPVLPGETPALVEKRDFNIAAQFARTDILQALQQGGRNIDIGNVNQSFSAVAIAAIEEIRKKGLISRFQACDTFYRRLAWMIKDQYKLLSPPSGFAIGRLGQSKIYSHADIDGDYIVKTRFMSKSKEMEIANIAIASAAKSIGIPDKLIVRDILLAENPEEILAAMEEAKAEAFDPVIGLMRRGLALIDEAENLDGEEKEAKLLESQLLCERAVTVLRIRQQPQVAPQELPQPEQPKGNANALLPLLGRGTAQAKEGEGAV